MVPSLFFFFLLWIVPNFCLIHQFEWTEIQKIESPDQQSLINPVSIDGDYAIIGTSADDVNGRSSGSAFIFVRNGTNWTQQAKLVPSDGSSSDIFGCSVDISGDYAIIGAQNDEDNGFESGSAYIFHRNGETWSQQWKLTANDGAEEDHFGKSVSISGDYAIVGAFEDDDKGENSGSAYVFVRDGISWSFQSKLNASNGQSLDRFGRSVSISGDRAIVGAYNDGTNGLFSGSAYVFFRQGTIWVEQQRIAPSSLESGDYFGDSVDIAGNYAIIGARGDDDFGEQSGSAFVFVANGNVWTQQAKLRASDGAAYDKFGVSVSISGNYAIVGAEGDDDVGSAYIFERNETTWEEVSKIAASSPNTFTGFGSFVGISNNDTIVGSNNGIAYIFENIEVKNETTTTGSTTNEIDEGTTGTNTDDRDNNPSSSVISSFSIWTIALVCFICSFQ